MSNLPLLSDTLHTAVDWLMYRSYEHNRDLSPEIPAEKWNKIYKDAEVYKTIYDGKENQK